MTFLTKAGLIAKTRRKSTAALRRVGFSWRRTRRVTLQDLKSLEGWDDAGQTSSKKKTDVDETAQTQTPTERLDAAVTPLNTDVKDRLSSAVLGKAALPGRCKLRASLLGDIVQRRSVVHFTVSREDKGREPAGPSPCLLCGDEEVVSYGTRTKFTS